MIIYIFKWLKKTNIIIHYHVYALMAQKDRFSTWQPHAPSAPPLMPMQTVVASTRGRAFERLPYVCPEPVLVN
jgi:hypothetical protein